MLHLLSICTPRIADLDPHLTSITQLLTEVPSTLRHHAALPGLTQPIFLFVSSVLQQINDHPSEASSFVSIVPDLLKVVNSLLANRSSQTIALDSLYDVIIQGDCLKGNWKPIISGLKVSIENHDYF